MAFREEDLGNGCSLLRCGVPALAKPDFEALWSLHPADYARIENWGKPRWQQAYQFDYRFSGITSVTLPLPALLQPLLAWCQEEIDSRLNGLLVNRYNGDLGHHIGEHHDSTKNLAADTPIVTISLGASPCFQLLRRGRIVEEFPATDGTVFVIKQTNAVSSTGSRTAPIAPGAASRSRFAAL